MNPKRKKRRARPRRRKAKVTRTRTITTRIVRSNPKRRSPKRTRSRKARPRRRRGNPRTFRWKGSKRDSTVVFLSRAQGRALIDSMPSPQKRRAWHRALKPYPGGGVYIALPAWRFSWGTAHKVAAAVLTRLAYEAGRRRKRFSGVAPRVANSPR